MPTPPPSLRERQREQTREHLIRTTEELMASQGFAGTAIDDIVTAAGTSRGTLYAHFSGKDALLEAIVLRMYDDALRDYEALNALPDLGKPSVHGWAHALGQKRLITGSRHLAVIAATPAIFFPNSAMTPRFERLIEEVRRNGAMWHEFETVEADERARMLVGLVEGVALRLVSEPEGRHDLNTFANHLSNAVLKMIEAP